MRKGNAPFVFSACLVALLALADCGGDDGNVPPVSGAGGNSSGAGGIGAATGGDAGEFDGGRGGTRFIFDAQALRDINDPNCPSTMPMDNDPCTPAATCAYPGGGCTCQREHGDAGRTWHCQEFPQRDGGYMMCADMTASGTGCEVQGKFCSTGNQTCICFGTNQNDRKWTCF
jgi:hypothetical protein